MKGMSVTEGAEAAGIFPYGTPVERQYWLMGVCFSRVAYCPQGARLYPFFAYDTDPHFVKQIRDLFGISSAILTAMPRRKGHMIQYRFSFPQSEHDYARCFLGVGIAHPKTKRRFPPLDGNEARHFFRGYCEAQCGITGPLPSHLDKITGLKKLIVSIHFANRRMAEGFRDYLFSRGIGRIVQPAGVIEPLTIYSVGKNRTAEIKLRWHNLGDFYKLLYHFPGKVTSRPTIRKAIRQSADLANALLFR